MNKLRKSLKELFQVNREAGLLRIFLAATLTFILWSILAAISASFKPLESLNLYNILRFNSQNLAISLFLDIINAYFSTFTISLFILFFLVAFLSFETVADFYTNLKSFSSNRYGRDQLSSWVFSFPKCKKFLFPDDFFNTSGNIPDGPLVAVIKPGYALLVSSGANHVIKFNNPDNPHNFEVSIAFREKILNCFNFNSASISFKTEDQTSGKSFLMEIAYSYNLPTDTENMTKFVNMLEPSGSEKIQNTIESILISETKLTLSQYFRFSSRSAALTFGQIPEKPIHKNQFNNNELLQKKHTLIFNLYKKVQDQGIKRNRKRPVYISPSPEVSLVSINQEENLSPSLKDQLNELLAKNLQRSLITLFGTDSVKAQVINILEQGSK